MASDGDDKSSLANADLIDLTQVFMSNNPQVSKDLVEFFASAMDALLQFYMDSANHEYGSQDEMLSARSVAATRVAQMCKHAFEVFGLGAEALAYGNTADTDACNAAAETVSLMVIKNLKKLMNKAQLPPTEGRDMN
jgi:hypothetical protein